jgi:predicted DNA repair protein MutK
MADPHVATPSPLIGDTSSLFETLERLLHGVDRLDEEEDDDARGPSIEPPGWRDPPRERR